MSSFLQLELFRIKKNLPVFICIVITALLVIGIGYIHTEMVQYCGYLIAMLVSAICVDYYSFKKPSVHEFIVRKPRKEAVVVAICVAIGCIMLVVRFMGPVKWENIRGLLRLVLGISMIVFAFPVALAAIFLAFKYKPRELGIRLQGLLAALVVFVIVFIISRIVAPDSLTWDKLYKSEGGIVMLLFTGIFGAGLSEEFLKMIGQTRFGAVLNNKGVGWLIITIIWALMHVPNFYSQGGDMKEAVIGAVRIIPIGLMWGYLTHRTKSILPATLVHGTNVWGLQNF